MARSRKAQPFLAFSRYWVAASGNCFLNVGEEAHWASAAVAAAVAAVVFGKTTCGSPGSGRTTISYSRARGHTLQLWRGMPGIVLVVSAFLGQRLVNGLKLAGHIWHFGWSKMTFLVGEAREGELVGSAATLMINAQRIGTRESGRSALVN